MSIVFHQRHFFFFTESYLLTLRVKSNNIQSHILSLILTRINPSLEVTLFTTENQNGIPEILPLVPDTVCMNGGANERPGPLENPNCLGPPLWVLSARSPYHDALHSDCHGISCTRTAPGPRGVSLGPAVCGKDAPACPSGSRCSQGDP